MKRADNEAQHDPTVLSSSPSSNITPETGRSHDPYQALRFGNFRLLFIGTFIASIGEQMLGVAIGWELYERTGSAFLLGLVGLVQVLPVIAFSLPAGHIADRYNRKRIVLISQVFLALGSFGLMVLSFLQGPLVLIYACLFVIGAAAAFNGPASAVLLSQVIPAQSFENAATWSSSSWQLASVIGPAIGGIAIAISHSATPVYFINAFAMLVYMGLIWPLKMMPQKAVSNEQTTLHSLAEGLSFLGRTKIILAAITLDLFAVLFGGAVTLLPIFAKDILQVGPTGLGWLRAAPSIGAVSMAFVLAYRPPLKRAGWTLLIAVSGFGIATIIFGLSHSFWLSVLMLALLGGLDNISVIIRSTLLLTQPPEEMRGRVSSVNELFIATSNQLGGFESGLTAQFFGPVLSVVGGGIGTVLVVIVIALLWPELRRLRSLTPARS